jgi:hypothetical protein
VEIGNARRSGNALRDFVERRIAARTLTARSYGVTRAPRAVGASDALDVCRGDCGIVGQ